MKKSVFLFGYGIQGRAIAAGLKAETFRIHIIESSEPHHTQAREDGYVDTALIDVTEDAALARFDIKEEDDIICVMDDEHLNVFLTLSLRSLFPKTKIVAISDSIHTAQKLKMAGASKVIDLYQVSANRIHNILKKPVATKLLDGFVLQDGGISFKEMIIPKGSYLDGMVVDDVNFHYHGILLIGMIDVELSHKFIFVTNGTNHKLDIGDTIVCIGELEDLERFEQHIAGGKQ